MVESTMVGVVRRVRDARIFRAAPPLLKTPIQAGEAVPASDVPYLAVRIPRSMAARIRRMMPSL